MVIPEFTNNKGEYLFFEFMINQVSYILSLIINEAELIIYEEIINKSESTTWKYIMQEEFDLLNENQIWQLIELSPESKILDGR
jgi:hypothetical protein